MLHKEAILNDLNKLDRIRLVSQMESEMNSDIKKLMSEIRDVVTQMKKSRLQLI